MGRITPSGGSGTTLTSYVGQVEALSDYPTTFPAADEIETVVYSGNVGVARPAAGFVVWQGFPTQPTHVADGDLWLSDLGGTILNGSGAPTNGDGANGDFWIRTSNSTLYGPKAAGVWPSGVSLVGAAGAAGASLTPTASKTANYTAVASDFVLCNATGGAFTVTLPTPTAGIQVGIKKTDSSANAVTVATTSGTIDGSSTRTVSVQYGAQVYVADGTNWHRVTVPQVTAIAATGTPSSVTYLRGDGSWASPAAATTFDKAAILGPTGTVRATANRLEAALTSQALTSGTLYLVAIALVAGDTISAANIRINTTLGSNTHTWAVLCDSSRTVLAVSGDTTSASITGPADKAFALSYAVPTTGFYYVGVMTTATSGNIQAGTLGLQALTSTPIGAGTSSTAQTTPPSVSATMGAITALANPVPYIWLT